MERQCGVSCKFCKGRWQTCMFTYSALRRALNPGCSPVLAFHNNCNDGSKTALTSSIFAKVESFGGGRPRRERFLARS